MTVQISGSIAFDTIMVFEGRFREHILPDQVHMLNVAFLAPEMRQEYGGCAANIAYTLRGLGQDCGLLGAIGKDGKAYLERLSGLGIDVSQVLHANDCFSAQAFITTDLDDNQITAFHPGAMNRAGEVGLGKAAAHAKLGIISPNGKEAMLRHAQEFHQHQVPFIFDPGQAMPVFNAQELSMLVDLATWVAVNDYEGHMLCEKLGIDLQELARRTCTPSRSASSQGAPAANRVAANAGSLGGLIVTKGASGVEIFEQSVKTLVEGVDVSRVLGAKPQDPTGCGDAFRGGLLHGLAQGASLVDSARLGNVMGALKVVHRGAQNHAIQVNEVKRLFQELYPQAGMASLF